MKYDRTVGFPICENRKKPTRMPSDPDPPNRDLPNSDYLTKRNTK